MRETQDPSNVQDDSQPSEELLQEAIKVANEALDMYADSSDMTNARVALDDLALGNISPWGLLIVGYVAVARRGGRT